MNTSKIIVIAMVALMAVPAAVYADHAFTASYKNEQVVEGHTVYAILTAEYDRDDDNRSEQGTAVAVLVRERICQANRAAIDGVLWFNDQFLVGEEREIDEEVCYFRYPCRGTVYAVNAGMPNPIRSGGTWITPATYVHSYKITDPNDHEWIIDYWTLVGIPGPAGSVWTVNIQGVTNDVASTPVNDEMGSDNGKEDCVPFTDDTDHEASVPVTARRSGQYPDIDYNAVLFMLWRHIAVGADVKQHGNDSVGNYGANASEDTAKPNCADTESGNCDSTSPSDDPTPTGGYNDDWEGNSHPWNPYPMDGGVDNGPNHTHETGRVDIYYVPVSRPVPHNDVAYEVQNQTNIPLGMGLTTPPRRFYINDLMGDEQCFHNHGAAPTPPACNDGDPRGPAYYTYDEDLGDLPAAVDPNA